MGAVAAREGGGGSGSAGRGLPPGCGGSCSSRARLLLSGAVSERVLPQRLPPEGDAGSPCAGRESLDVQRRHLDDSGER